MSPSIIIYVLTQFRKAVVLKQLYAKENAGKDTSSLNIKRENAFQIH